MKKVSFNHRSAINGQFVRESQVKKSPSTTVSEKRKPVCKSIKKIKK